MSWFLNNSRPGIGASDNSTRDIWSSSLGGFGGLGEDGSDLLDRLDKLKEETTQFDEPCRIAQSIITYYLWVLCAIGIPGNVITIVTILTMQALSPATFFVALLAFFDGIALLMKGIFFFLPHFNVIEITDIYCKMSFLVYFCVTIANWMLVLICLERFVSVCFPLKKVYLFTKKRSYILASVVITFFFIVYAALFMEMRTSAVGTRCGTKAKYSAFWVPYYFAFNAGVMLFIPFLIILVLTIGIIRGLYVSRHVWGSHMSKGSKTSSGVAGNDGSAMNNQRLLQERKRTERTITIMMILAATLFLVLILPGCVYIIGSYSNGTSFSQCATSRLTANWELFKQIQHVIVDSSHAINFFLYFLTAKRFREQLFKMLRCKTCKKQKYKTKHPNTDSSQLSTSSRAHHSVIPLSPTVGAH